MQCWHYDGRLNCYANGRKHSWAVTEFPVPEIYGCTTGYYGDWWFTSPRGVVHVMDGRPAQIYTGAAHLSSE